MIRCEAKFPREREEGGRENKSKNWQLSTI